MDKILKQHKATREVLLNALNNKEMSIETYKKIFHELAYLRYCINSLKSREGKETTYENSGLNKPAVIKSVCENYKPKCEHLYDHRKCIKCGKPRY